MTLTLVATILCDECYEVMVIDDSNLKARHADVVSGERGWSRDTEGHHYCPPCTAEKK